MDLDIYLHREGFKVNISSLEPYVKITSDYKDIAEDSVCKMKVGSLLQSCKLNLPVPVNWNLEVISPYFALFKNVVHSLKPGETPSNSVSYQAPYYMQRS